MVLNCNPNYEILLHSYFLNIKNQQFLHCSHNKLKKLNIKHFQDVNDKGFCRMNCPDMGGFCKANDKVIGRSYCWFTWKWDDGLLFVVNSFRFFFSRNFINAVYLFKNFLLLNYYNEDLQRIFYFFFIKP